MTVQHSVAVRNARNDAIETTIGASPVLRIRTGAQPANCAAARSGTVLATVTLPADWASASSGGVKSFLGSWTDPAADATGTAGHYEIMDSTLTTCHQQGSVGTSAADMIVDSVNFTAGQTFNVTGYSITDGNA
jgi:hypothetical protein